MTLKKGLIIVGVLLIIGAIVAANLYYKRETGLSVTAESLRTRDLESFVSASGKIQPKRQVNISANQMGRVTRLAVQEGERVKAGQFLLEIDPRSLNSQLERGQAMVAAAESALQRAQTTVEQSKANLALSKQSLTRQQQLWKEGLTTRQDLERAENELAVREADLKATLQEIETSGQRIKQEEASLSSTKVNLTEVIISSPMDGIVVRRNIEEGETAVVGTMNNAGSQLLTIADMSQLEAEVEVDETDIPTVSLGQQARVTIDAIPDRTFRGHVTEIANSPIQQGTGAQASTGRQATNFKVVITLDEQVPDVRPGFTCTAEIVTANRTSVVAVPIQALTVREMLFDAKGTLVHEVRDQAAGVEPTVDAASAEPPPGHTRKETEGVFLLKNGTAVFTPVKVGVAGERYFEVLNGVAAGDRVITGPFASVRGLADGAQVRVTAQAASAQVGTGPERQVKPLIESVWIALQSIWANKLRSFLTVLGNIVAVTSIVTVVSLIQGMNATVSGVIVGNVGADNIRVERMPMIRTEEDEERNRNNPLITLREADAIRAFSPAIQAVMAQAQRRDIVSYRTRELQSVVVTGVTADYGDFATYDAERGRVMSPSEVARGQRVTILGYDVADELFGDINPLDKQIVIAGTQFRVVGVSARKGSVFGNSQDTFAVIPLGMYQKMFGARQSLALMVKPATTEMLSAAMDDTTLALRIGRRLKPSEPDNFGLLTSDTVMGIYQQATNGIFSILIGVVALSLLVGGIVIMNIMLMAVSERTREIGLRKALGAKRRDIMSQILTESVTLSTCGGLVGIALGFVAAQAIAYFSPLAATLELWSVVLGIGITAGVGLFFGAYPASRAAGLDPIEALRRE